MPLRDNQPVQIGITVVLLVLALLAVATRYYVRLSNKTFGLDDWLVAFGALFFTIQCATTIGGAVNGIGLQTEHITSNEMYIQGGKWFYFFNIFYTIAALFVRLSVLNTLLRIVASRGYKFSIYAVAFAVSASSLQNIIFLLIQCKPISWYWDKYTTPTGSCFAGTTISANTISVAAMGATTDTFSATLPIILLWNVQMNMRVKISVCLMLGLGIFAAIAIIVRLPISVNLQYHEESFYSVSIPVIWSAAEIGIGIVATSLPALRPLLRRFLGSSRGYSNTAGSYGPRGTVPSGNMLFRSSIRTNGMKKLSEPGDSESWQGAGGGDIKVQDSTYGQQYELQNMKPKPFTSKTVVSGGSSNAKLDGNEDINGDANSETEILDDQHRMAIKTETTFKVEFVKDLP